MTNSPPAGTVSVSPVAWSRSTRWSSQPSPPPSTISLRTRTVTLAVDCDLADEVVRHPGVEGSGAHHQRHAPGVPGEVERRLAGGVGAPEDVDVPPGHGGCFGAGAAVEDTHAVQRFQSRKAEPAIAGARRQDDRAPSYPAEVGEVDREPVVDATKIGGLLHEREVGTEHPGLLVRPLRQPPAADPPRKAEVVADQRTGRGLPPDAPVVDDQGAEPLGGAVDRSRQSGRPGADDDQIEVLALRCHRGARRRSRSRRCWGSPGPCRSAARSAEAEPSCPRRPPAPGRRSSRPN